jgi:RNA polymerase sigma factor (TIGR02999 family)
MNEVSRILDQIGQGEPSSTKKLLPLVYEELRKLAAAKLAQEKPGQTFQATALVHEAYLRLVGQACDQQWDHRGHFFAAAAEAMRRLLVESARRKKSLKRGGALSRVPICDIAARDADEQLILLDEALTQLGAEDPLAARVVELHHFAGLPHEHVASSLEITVYQARQKWAFARAWLKSSLADF